MKLVSFPENGINVWSFVTINLSVSPYVNCQCRNNIIFVFFQEPRVPVIIEDAAAAVRLDQLHLESSSKVLGSRLLLTPFLTSCP